MKRRMKLRKRDAKRIAKYLARNMDAMQFDITLSRVAGDYAGKWGGKVGDAADGAVEKPDVGYVYVEDENENELQSVRWNSVKDFSAQSFSEQQVKAVEASRKRDIELKGRADIRTEKDEFGVQHCVLTGYIVHLIADMLNPINLEEFQLTSSFVLERTTDGELRIRFPFKKVRDYA